jgi:hydrogenase maturation protease
MNAPAEYPRVTLADFDDPSTLIYGIGNVGRQDDGLGWSFIDRLEAGSLCSRAEMQRHYQLHLEDADLISRKRKVLFIDATKEASVASFSLERAEPRMDFSFTSHAISIPSVMATCQRCFQYLPEVYVLAIRGYEWELRMGLTPQARHNLDDAIAHLSKRAERQVS